MKEQEWIRGQLLQLIERADIESLWILLTIARAKIK